MEDAADSVPGHMVDALVVHGTPADCRDAIRGYVSDGVDEPVVYPAEVTGRFPRDLNRAISLMAR